MTDIQATRRKFLQLIGLSAGSATIGDNLFASNHTNDKILKLKPAQQEFMLMYESWMDEFIEVMRIQKKEPENQANQKKMIALTDIAEEWKPYLREFLKDENFSVIYQTSIERMKKEIG